MVTITVNYNNDSIEIDDGKLISSTTYKKRITMHDISKLLEEIINVINPDKVTLQSIDEDNRHTIGEW